MKLKYKKMVIIATICAMAIGFIALMFLDTGDLSDNAEDADLALNEIPKINELIENYFTAKKTVDVEAMSDLVSDSSRIPEDLYTVRASYVEDYSNFDCYVIESEDLGAYRVYVKYYMKLKNIESLVPCLVKYYIKVTSEGKYVIYLSALDDAEVEFIDSADNNPEIEKLIEDVHDELNSIMEEDAAFKQFYQKMEKEIAAASEASSASGSAVSGSATTTATATPTQTS